MKIRYLLFAISLIVACSNEQEPIKDAGSKKLDTIKPVEPHIEDDTIFTFFEYDEIAYTNPQNKFEVRVKYIGHGMSKLAVVKYNNKFGDTTDAAAFILSQTGEFEEVAFVESDDGSVYFYINLHIPGGSMGNDGHTCLLVNAHSKQEYYYYLHNYPDGYLVSTTDVTKSDNLQPESFPFSFLNKKIKVILKKYRLTKTEKARYNFYLDNFKNYTEGDKLRLKFRKTKTKLFDINRVYDDKIAPSVNAQAKNSRYIVIAFYKDATYCYDKKTKEYFCLWTTSSIYDHAQSVTFINHNTVELLGDGHQVSINIKTGECTPVKEEFCSH